MKRDVPPSDLYPNLFSHFGWFFWQRCAQCQMQFRRENGWLFVTGPWHGGFGRTLYLCAECGPEAGIAAAVFMRLTAPPARPPAPPAPPARRATNAGAK